MASTPKAGSTARQRARTELTREIKAEARRQLAAHGAQQLSLRAVARELGMVSSTIYRYFPSRDDLMTALIIDAYDSLGAAAEKAGQSQPAPEVRGRWRAVCTAARNWALANPHEYALIYGSPVPGYRAPETTIAPAARVAVVFGQILAEASGPGKDPEPGQGTAAVPEVGPASGPGNGAAAWPEKGRHGGPGDGPAGFTPLLGQQMTGLAAVIAPGVPAPVVARGLIAWTQLFGMISFELFGQFVGTADPADEFFGYAVDQMATLVGLD
ncbi:MAG: TetR/AcrR family transcriptional regulator [Streptosporangiaceae bacterium]